MRSCIWSCADGTPDPFSARDPGDPREALDEYRLSPGIAVETSDAGSRQFVAYGYRDFGTRAPVTRDTIFEIGSITKLFTSLLLADMAHRREVSLGDPVRLYLPPEVHVPERDGRQITLAHLATHTSGLPRMPAISNPKTEALHSRTTPQNTSTSF